MLFLPLLYYFVSMKLRFFFQVFSVVTLALLFSPKSRAQADSSNSKVHDSIAAAQQDRILDEKEDESNKILSEADSIQRADSLEQLRLEEELAGLRSSDKSRKRQLQAQIDSIKKSEEERELAIKQRIDSLRSTTPGVPVVVFQDTLFNIYAKLGPFTPSERAKSIAQKIEFLVDENIFNPNALHIFENDESYDVIHDEMILFSVTDRDAFWLDQPKKEVAQGHIDQIITSVHEYKRRTGLLFTLMRLGMTVLVLAALIFIITFLNRKFLVFNNWLLDRIKPYVNGVKFRNYEFISEEREEQMIGWLLNVLKWILIIILVYISLPVIFSIFPTTKSYAINLFRFVFDPLVDFSLGIVEYIPNLFAIIIIAALTRYFIKLLHFLSSEIEIGKLQIPGFYPDWAKPTLNILRLIVYAFAFVVAFPYLPGSDSPVFQGVSVFFGLLISLGSSSAISNIIAGLVITYMRAFKVGDRVKIGETTGDVLEKSMLVTRLRTIKNEEVTIPNSAILNGSTVNYSTSADTMGLILNTTVTIGYDVPWRKVHDLLISAALDIDAIKKEPKPFVLQTSLDDFYVSYQINAYTEYASKAAAIYSELHSKIQDKFNEEGVEILSPHYRAARDGNMTTIPPDYLPSDYTQPHFKITYIKED